MCLKILFSIIVAMIILTACAEKENPTPALPAPTLLAPADGSTIAQNPPLFVWSTVDKESIIYLLEVATDPIFLFPFIRISAVISLPDTEYLADSAFAPGNYYWRMCTQEDC